MSEFKVGDLVVVRGEDDVDDGNTGEVVHVLDEDHMLLRFANIDSWFVFTRCCTLVKSNRLFPRKITDNTYYARHS